MATLEPENRVPDPSTEEASVVQQFKDFLRPHVSRLHSTIPSRKAGPSWTPSLAVLDRYGLRPATVFDIGVAYGTYELYRAFPDAHYHLIVPTRESLVPHARTGSPAELRHPRRGAGQP